MQLLGGWEAPRVGGTGRWSGCVCQSFGATCLPPLIRQKLRFREPKEGKRCLVRACIGR